MSVVKTDRNHKAVLRGLPEDGPLSVPKPQQVLYCTLGEAVKWGKQTIDGLTDAQKKTAFVLVTEVCEVKVMEIHAAVTAGEFAIANFNQD